MRASSNAPRVPGTRAPHPLRGGARRYALLLVGLGAAGIAIGWVVPASQPAVPTTAQPAGQPGPAVR